MEIIALVIGLLLGSVITGLYLKLSGKSEAGDNQERELLEQITQLDKKNGILEDRLRNADEVYRDQQQQIKEKTIHVADLRSEISKWEAKYTGLEDKLSNQEKDMEKLQQKFTTEFENIANRLLKSNSEEFTTRNKENIDAILKPLKENIKTFQEKVEKTHNETRERNAALNEQIKSLKDLNEQMSKEAINLTKALKGDSKKQGNWGEVVLERILERSGLIKGQEYLTQVSTTTEEGKRLQPDVVVLLPEDKHIIVDSKVSLVAYEAYVNCEEEDDKQKFLKSHIDSVKTHIKSLSEKGYHTTGDMNAPDFVLLFIPIESSFSVAITADQDLFGYAWDKKVVIVSPSTLLATLRTIASIWKQERQTRNVLEIANEGGKLYDKFVGFVEDLSKLGDTIRKASKTYDSVYNKLTDGRGNLVRQTEKLRKLGANVKKALPKDVLVDALENSDDDEQDDNSEIIL